MVEECPRMKALYDFLKAGVNDRDRKWAAYAALATDLPDFLDPELSLASASASSTPHSAPASSTTFEINLGPSAPTTCSTACLVGDTRSTSTPCIPAASVASTPAVALASSASSPSQWNMDDDVYPPLAALRRQVMSDAEWAAMSDWEKDLWEMKHLPEKQRLASIEGIVEWVPEAQRDRRRVELLEEVLRSGKPVAAPAPALASSTSAPMSDVSTEVLNVDAHISPSTCSTLCVSGDTGATVACTIDFVLAALPPASSVSLADATGITSVTDDGNKLALMEPIRYSSLCLNPDTSAAWTSISSREWHIAWLVYMHHQFLLYTWSYAVMRSLGDASHGTPNLRWPLGHELLISAQDKVAVVIIHAQAVHGVNEMEFSVQPIRGTVVSPPPAKPPDYGTLLVRTALQLEAHEVIICPGVPWACVWSRGHSSNGVTIGKCCGKIVDLTCVPAVAYPSQIFPAVVPKLVLLFHSRVERDCCVIQQKILVQICVAYNDQ